MASSIILNIPHASTLLPVVDIPAPYQEPSGAAYWAWRGKAVVKKRIREKYVAELKYMTDWFVDELFINGVGKPLVAPVSRLLCDMERFKDDMKEEMSIIGMGVCYTSTHDLENLAYFKMNHKLEMIKKYYDPTELKDYSLLAGDEEKLLCALFDAIKGYSSKNVWQLIDKYGISPLTNKNGTTPLDTAKLLLAENKGTVDYCEMPGLACLRIYNMLKLKEKQLCSKSDK